MKVATLSSIHLCIYCIACSAILLFVPLHTLEQKKNMLLYFEMCVVRYTTTADTYIVMTQYTPLAKNAATVHTLKVKWEN